jgi:large subunit ribosomal protein L18Ae
MRPHLKHYQVVGRATPSESDANPTVYKFEVFAPNFVVAKSKFWTLMRDKNKVKATKGDILSCKVVKDRKIAARNYSVDVCYYSQACGYTQMTKEFRDVSRAGAVSQAYNDLASKHRARYQSIDVLGVKSIDGNAVTRAFVTQFNNSKLAFPLLHRRVQPNRKDRAIFKAKQSSRTLY